jgi:hypothetical protein
LWEGGIGKRFEGKMKMGFLGRINPERKKKKKKKKKKKELRD